MPESTRTTLLASLLLFSLALCGCRSIYSDTYSYRRNRFQKDKEKVPQLPPAGKTAPGGDAGGIPGGDAIPGAEGALPGVPGLVPAADPAAPALPAIPGL